MIVEVVTNQNNLVKSFFFLMTRFPPRYTLFPYTTLFRSVDYGSYEIVVCAALGPRGRGVSVDDEDRKSTRLNSSHRCTSYAVFCLKKKSNSRTCIRNHKTCFGRIP